MPLPILLLDLGGVVFQSTGISNSVIDWSVISQLNQVYGHRLNLGHDLFPAFLSDYNQLTKQNLNGESFLSQLFDTLRVNQELIDFLQSRFRLFLCSDNYRENITYLAERYEFATWTAGQFYSFQYELCKSDPALFQQILTELAEPGSSVYLLDDDPNNLRVAATFGIQGVQFMNNEQVFGELG